MVPDLSIRTVLREDLPGLMELYRHLVPSDPRLEQERVTEIWERFLCYEGSSIFVGVGDGIFVTTCTLVVIPNLTRGGASYALIENVVTHAKHRGQGYGKAILKAAVSAAWALDCYKVMVLSGSKNPATLGFYDRAGFERSKTGFETRRLPPRES
jgi:GNAT superfamily N-acetyltransferase